MAFKIANLMAVANNKNKGAGIPNKFAYWNEDNDTATTSGLIPNTVGVKEGDQVEVIANTKGAHVFYEATVVSNAIVLVAYV